MTNKFTVAFCTLFLVVQLAQAQRKTKDCQISKFEDRLNSMLGYFGYRDHKWPENEKEMSDWCKAWQKDKPPAKKYTLECLTGMAKTMGSVIIYSVEKVDRLACTNKQERANHIATGKCGNKSKKGSKKCWDGLQTLMINMKKLQDAKDKIPTLCCSFFWWKECTLESYRKNAPTCSEANVEYIEKIIDKGSLDPLNLLCSDYDQSDRCDKVKSKFDRTKVPIKYRTFFPALFEFFETL